LIFTQKYNRVNKGGFMIMSSLPSAAADLIEIGKKPNPDYKPTQSKVFGIKSINYTSFQAAWYGKWKWLHYDQVLTR